MCKLTHSTAKPSTANKTKPKQILRIRQPTKNSYHAFMNLFFNVYWVWGIMVHLQNITMNRTNTFLASRSSYANEDMQTRTQKLQYCSIWSVMMGKFKMLWRYLNGILQTQEIRVDFLKEVTSELRPEGWAEDSQLKRNGQPLFAEAQRQEWA